MKHNIIKTENYLMVVDGSEINVGDWIYKSNSNTVNIAGKGYHNFTQSDAKIIAHLPLNNSPVLEFVPLLPPLEDEVEEAEEVFKEVLDSETKQVYDKMLLGATEHGFIIGYNKAKEKYKYTEEDLRNAIDMARKFPYITKGEIKFNTPIDEIIKFIQQPKIPVAFECEMKQKSVNGSIPVNQEWEYEPKTTTNPQGQTVLVGKYIY